MSTLPTQPSALIRVALADLKAITIVSVWDDGMVLTMRGVVQFASLEQSWLKVLMPILD